MQSAVEEVDRGGIVAVCIDIAEGRAAIDVTIDKREVRPRSGRDGADIDDDITRGAGGFAIAAAEHFSDMRGIGTHLATKQINTRHAADGRLVGVSFGHQHTIQIHLTGILSCSVGIITIAACVDVAVHLAARDNHKRSIAHCAADITAAE